MTRSRPDARREDPGGAWDKIADGLEQLAPMCVNEDVAKRVKGLVRLSRDFAEARRKVVPS